LKEGAVKAETRVGIFIIIAVGIFIYLSINIKAFRLDRNQYYTYKTYFDDTGGLDVRSPVRIAGVDVGWVESIMLMEGGKAEVVLRVHKRNKLAKNAYATITQEGLIGTKVLEIDPGDPATGFLIPGSVLAIPGKSPASVSDLMDQFRDIASSIQDVALSFKNVFSSPRGEENLKMALEGITKASNRIADFSEVLNRTLQKNEENINMALLDMRRVMGNMNVTVPSIRKDFDSITVALADDTLPKISDASEQARETFKEAEQVVEKINTGKGLIGKLVNEDETYGELKKAIKGLKDYLTKAQSLRINVDMHSEYLFRDWYSKGYFEVKIHPNQDSFYVLQLATDEYGSIKRDVIMRERIDSDGNRMIADELLKDALQGKRDTFDKTRAEIAKLENPETERIITRRENDFLLGFQFGKRFDRLSLRIGLFENSFGVGADYFFPTPSDKFHLSTTLEIFDFRGKRRLDDGRPHVKWLTKLYFMKHIYTAVGVDDAISRHNGSLFWGSGIRFNEDDLKYVLSLLPLGFAKR